MISLFGMILAVIVGTIILSFSSTGSVFAAIIYFVCGVLFVLLALYLLLYFEIVQFVIYIVCAIICIVFALILDDHSEKIKYRWS
jgi:hypothetical protein